MGVLVMDEKDKIMRLLQNIDDPHLLKLIREIIEHIIY
jgi:hypothetical protein